MIGLRQGLGLALAAALLAGCQQDPSPEASAELAKVDRRAVNVWSVEAYTNRMIENGVLTQRTLLPYHFTTGTADLTELGERDLGVLAAYLAEHGGTINVRRGDADEALYEARLAAVRRALTERGVEQGRVTLADEPAGGEGLVAERVLVIMGAEPERPVYPLSVHQVYSNDNATSTMGGYQ